MKVVLTAMILSAFASFSWAVFRFFQGPASPMMRVVSALSLLFVGIALWSITRNDTSLAFQTASLGALLGALILFWWALREARNTALHLAFSSGVPAALLRSGPYRCVRHPFYSAYTVFWAGTFLAYPTLLTAIAPVAMFALYAGAARREERRLAESPLASEYGTYSRATGRFLPRFPATRLVALVTRDSAAHVALAMLLRDARRTIAAVLGIAFSYFLMVFQGGLFVGFLASAATVVDSLNADIWITGHDTPSIEFGGPVRDALVGEIAGIDGVTDVSRLVAGFVRWSGPDGQRRSIALVGSERSHAGWRERAERPNLTPESILVDRSSLANLGVKEFPASVEVNGRRAQLVGSTDGFATFLGAPYAFADYEDARSWLGLVDEHTMFLLANVGSGFAVRDVIETIERRYPELQVSTSRELATRSGRFWMIETGAGGGIALAGILGLVIGILIISQILYAMTMDLLSEFATLQAVGAPVRFCERIVSVKALVLALCGAAVGFLALWPIAALVRSFVVAWLAVPWWLPPICLLIALLAARVAAQASLRLIRRVDPIRVFQQ